MTDNIALYTAFFDVARDVRALGKSDMNTHGNYKFVPVDRYYETVGVLAARFGLGWVLREVDVEVLSVGKGIARFTYEVDLFHVSGAAVSGFSRVTVLHPIQGAQTAGSAMSYADKVWMRQAFKIATGEADGDWTDPKALDGAAAPQATTNAIGLDTTGDVPKVTLPNGPPDWSSVEAIFLTFIPTCASNDMLQDFWSENLQVIGALKDHNAAMHKRVVQAFSKRKKELADA